MVVEEEGVAVEVAIVDVVDPMEDLVHRSLVEVAFQEDN